MTKRELLDWATKAAWLLDKWGACMADIKEHNWKSEEKCRMCDKTVQSLCRRTYAHWEKRPE